MDTSRISPHGIMLHMDVFQCQINMCFAIAQSLRIFDAFVWGPIVYQTKVTRRDSRDTEISREGRATGERSTQIMIVLRATQARRQIAFVVNMDIVAPGAMIRSGVKLCTPHSIISIIIHASLSAWRGRYL